MSCYHTITLYSFAGAQIPQDEMQKMERVFGMMVRYGGELPLPADGYDPVRGQWRAEAFLRILLSVGREPGEVVAGVTDEDLFSDGLNFVFGVALPHSVAVVATPRLHNSFYGLPEDEALFALRLLKELDHEIGHVLGLSHCPDPLCVMHFSNTLADTDKKGYDFCLRCRAKVEAVVCRGL